MRSTVDIRPFEDGDAEGVAWLSTIVQWPSLTDPDVVRAVCTAPGATSYVAIADGELVGWAQALGDGVLQSHLSFLAVHPDHRRRGIGRLLVQATFQATGTKRMDLITTRRRRSTAASNTRRWPGSGSTPGRDRRANGRARGR